MKKNRLNPGLITTDRTRHTIIHNTGNESVMIHRRHVKSISVIYEPLEHLIGETIRETSPRPLGGLGGLFLKISNVSIRLR